MIFEDQLVAAMALEVMLNMNGYESLGSYDSADMVVDLYNESQPDVILIDIMLNVTST